MKPKYLPTALLIIAAAVLTITGILLGQYPNVLAKAARICLECIGLG